MPKLSEKTLERRFQCDYCGETLRTRQGLSGHIQFKHKGYFKPSTKSKQITKTVDMLYISSKLKNLKIIQAINGMTESTNNNIAKLLVSCLEVIKIFSILEIEFTENDFKIYFLMALNRLLAKEL